MSEATGKKWGGRPALLQGAQLDTLAQLTQRMPHASLDDLTREFTRQTGIELCSATIRTALKKAGIARVRPPRRAGTRAAVQGTAPRRYGYTAAHRRHARLGGMNTDLTERMRPMAADARWTCIRPTTWSSRS